MGKLVPIILGVLCLVLFVVCVILGVLYGNAASKGPQGVCMTPKCLEDAARIKRYLNTSVDPCDNFYDFACGNLGEDETDPFERITIRILNRVREILQEPIKDYADNSTERKIKEYYASCLESDVAEDKKMDSLKELIKKIGGFDPHTPAGELNLDEFNIGKFDMDDALQYVQSDLATHATAYIDVVLQPVKETDELEAFATIKSDIGQCYSIVDEDGQPGWRFNHTKKFLEKLSECFGANARTQAAFATDVLDALTFTCKDHAIDPLVNFTTQRMTWNQLLLDQPWLQASHIDWFGLFSKPYREWNHQPFQIGSNGIRMMKRLSEMHTGLHMRKFRNFLIYQFLVNYNRGMPKCIGDAASYGEGVDPYKAVWTWKTCITRHLNPTFSLGVLAMLEKQMGQATVTDPKLHTMVKEIREAVLKRTLALPWLDDYLKKRIENIVANKVVMLSGPKRVVDDDYVDNFFKYLNINYTQPFLVNDVNARVFREQMNAGALRSPNIHFNLYIKNTNAMFVNARNMVYMGGIVMFWSILQQPFYDYYSQEYLQYGAIGAVIGHEFGHDFDGVHTYITWANETEVPVLVASESCLQDQYISIDYPGWEPPFKNRSMYLSNQGIPDVMGLQWSMEAYRKHVAERKKEDDRLPGLPYTQEQLFLIARAQLWCNHDTSWKFRTIRVLGSEALNPYFPEIWNCPKDAPMNPENKCNLW